MYFFENNYKFQTFLVYTVNLGKYRRGQAI